MSKEIIKKNIHVTNKLIIFLFIVVVSGCAAQHVVFDQAVIRNETDGIISDVKVLHEPTKKFGEVHSILPMSSFDLGFSKQRMLGKSAIITWTNKNGQKNKVELTLPLASSKVTKGQTTRLVYTIHPSGYVTVELKE